MPLLLLIRSLFRTAPTARTAIVPADGSVGRSFSQDPADVLDYTWNWATWLGDDTIASFLISASSGITVGQTAASDTAVTAWLSGGTAETSYTITCRITTALGRTKDVTITIFVRNF